MKTLFNSLRFLSPDLFSFYQCKSNVLLVSFLFDFKNVKNIGD